MVGRIGIARHGMRLLVADKFINVQAGTLLPGGINLSFCDGHVEYAKLNALWTYYWHALSVPQPMP
jgi:prepilin-type processing-associated H-X9-DG protein